MSIIRIFCIPGQSDPGKITQELVSLLMRKSKLTLLMRKSSRQFNNALKSTLKYTLKSTSTIK